MSIQKHLHTIAPVLLLAGSVYAFGSGFARTPSPSQEAVQPLEVDGTRIRAHTASGAFASADDLVGSVLVGRIDGGIRNAFRIDGIEVDPTDPTGEIVLYTLSIRDAATGAWKSACTKDARGIERGFPLAGTWTPTGEHVRTPGQLELTCTSGALGKCVRMGYKPWKSEAMWALHQACVRMVRADYCGDGVGHTRNGTPIDVYDPVGIQAEDPRDALTFEAAWGKDGAVCVNKTRVPDVTTLAEILAACPARIGGRTGAVCSKASARLDPRTLLFNKS